jgi:C4-dicarboxylate-specific signal transduction histidine kinase
VEDAASLCRHEYDRHRVKLSFRIDRTLPIVHCDSLQVQQVIVNLLRNSLESITDAGRHDGEVTIEAERQNDGQVLIRVRDNGPGFDRALLGKQITPFTTTKPEGLGLGLSLSRSIIESYGGRLTLGGNDKGADISFTLPTTNKGDEV